MKTKFVFLLLAIFIIAGNSCKKDESNTGTLVLKGVKPYPTTKSAQIKTIKNSPYESNTYVMHTANFMGFLLEIWASQGLVTEGVPDNFNWYKIGESNELKLIEEYLLTANDLPVGNYKSIKMVFKNIITRIAVHQSDINNTVLMQSSLSEEGCGDETILTQYFSKNGNHSLVDGIFQLNSGGENIRGFKINPGEVTTIFWKLGGPNSQITDCTFDWVDVNGNNAWDCGVDRTENFNCIAETPMFSFGVEDGEDETPEEGTVTDIDGNNYNVIKIGDQIWMKQNLKTGKLNDGTIIPYVTEPADWINNGIQQQPAQCVGYNNLEDILPGYGRLYNWYAVSTGKLCPTGWHIPTDSEWTTLTNYLGNNAGGKLKEKGTSYWRSPNVGATNESGFTARPGGVRIAGDIDFIFFTTAGFWWTATEKDTSIAFHRELHNENDIVPTEDYATSSYKMYGQSCRCIQD